MVCCVVDRDGISEICMARCGETLMSCDPSVLKLWPFGSRTRDGYTGQDTNDAREDGMFR